MYEDYSKSSMLHPERRTIDEHFCVCGNRLSVLIKVEKGIKISALISQGMSSINI